MNFIASQKPTDILLIFPCDILSNGNKQQTCNNGGRQSDKCWMYWFIATYRSMIEVNIKYLIVCRPVFHNF